MMAIEQVSEKQTKAEKHQNTFKLEKTTPAIFSKTSCSWTRDPRCDSIHMMGYIIVPRLSLLSLPAAGHVGSCDKKTLLLDE